jgi:hypothetical protein
MTGGERPTTSVQAHLEGHPFDLEALERLFAGGDTGVARNDDGTWVLYCPALEANWGDPTAVRDVSVRVIRRMNGVARAKNPLFRPVHVGGRFDGPGNSVSILAIDRAISREQAMPIGDGQQEQPSPGPSLLDKADDDDDVADALRFLGAPVDELDWFDLWKVFEVVRVHRRGGSELVAKGWLTDEERKRFTRSANDPAVSGDAARHARHSEVDADPMPLNEAQQLMSRLAWRWLVER